MNIYGQVFGSGITERNEQVVGKIPDAASISQELKELENSFEAGS